MRDPYVYENSRVLKNKLCKGGILLRYLPF